MTRSKAREPATKPASRSPNGRGRKTPTNLSLRSDLVHRARALRLNLSDVVEQALENAIIDAERAKWLAENEEAIEQYNAFVEKHGVFGDEFRAF